MQSPYGLNYGVATKLIPGVEEGIKYSQTMQDDQAKREATRSSIDEEGNYSPQMHAAALAERGIAPDPNEAYKYGMGQAAGARGGYNQAQTDYVNAKTRGTDVVTDLKLKNALIAKAANLANYIKQIPVTDRKAAVDEWLEVNPDVAPEAQDHFRALADESDKELDAAIVADPLQQKLLERRRIADQTETGKNARAGASIASRQKIAAQKADLAKQLQNMRTSGALTKLQAAHAIKPGNWANELYAAEIEAGKTPAEAAQTVTSFTKQGTIRAGETPEEFAGRITARMNEGSVRLMGRPMGAEDEDAAYQTNLKHGQRATASRPKTAANAPNLSGQKTNRPDGTYPLKGGGSVTVKGGIIQ